MAQSKSESTGFSLAPLEHAALGRSRGQAIPDDLWCNARALANSVVWRADNVVRHHHHWLNAAYELLSGALACALLAQVPQPIASVREFLLSDRFSYELGSLLMRRSYPTVSPLPVEITSVRAIALDCINAYVDRPAVLQTDAAR